MLSCEAQVGIRKSVVLSAASYSIFSFKHVVAFTLADAASVLLPVQILSVEAPEANAILPECFRLFLYRTVTRCIIAGSLL